MKPESYRVAIEPCEITFGNSPHVFYTCILFEFYNVGCTHSAESLRVLTSSLRILTTSLHVSRMFLYAESIASLCSSSRGRVGIGSQPCPKHYCLRQNPLSSHQRLNLKPHIFIIRLRIPFEFNKWLGNAFSFHIRLTSSKSVHNFRSYRLSRYALYRSLITSLAGFEPATFGSTILHLASAPSRH